MSRLELVSPPAAATAIAEAVPGNLKARLQAQFQAGLMATAENAPEIRFDCPECSDKGYTFVPAFNGYTAAKECLCRQRKRIAAALARIPRRFWHNGQPPRLATLAPRYDLVADEERARRIGDLQKAALAQMRQKPNDGFFFAGPRDCGKTHFSYALYAEAAEQGRRVWAGTVADLLAQYERAARGEPGQNGQIFTPELVPSQLAQDHTRWALLLDEVAYVRPTAFRHEKFFDLIDAAWKHGHQLVCTSNVRLADLARKWDDISGGNGDAVVKRLSADAHRRGFF